MSSELDHSIAYREDGTVKSETWYQDGVPHRDGAPASTYYDTDGNIQCEEWYQGGKHHRDDGPAVTSYYPDGSIARQEWWHHGERVTPPSLDLSVPEGGVEL